MEKNNHINDRRQEMIDFLVDLHKTAIFNALTTEKNQDSGSKVYVIQQNSKAKLIEEIIEVVQSSNFWDDFETKMRRVIYEANEEDRRLNEIANEAQGT